MGLLQNKRLTTMVSYIMKQSRASSLVPYTFLSRALRHKRFQHRSLNDMLLYASGTEREFVSEDIQIK